MKTSMQTSCKQCGICCTKGGAALHSKDLSLVRSQKILCKDLITIRKGEFAYNPTTEKVQATKQEIVKLRGTGHEWTCCYYDTHSHGCSIYSHRPHACRVLKCWQPEDSLALVEHDLLSRFDILKQETSLQKLISEHEQTCPLPDFISFPQKNSPQREKLLVCLEDAVNLDLDFRNKVVQESTRILEEEMFLFGRPLFQLLQPFGLLAYQSGNRLRLHVQGRV